MKFIKLASVWLILLGACLFAACKKETTPDSAPETQLPDSVMLPTKVDFYYKLSDTTNGESYRVGFDSLIYADGRLNKVIFDLAWVDPLIFSFGYTNEGKLASIEAVGDKRYNQDYYIHYVNNRIDSITIVDSSSTGVPFVHGSKMTYNAKGKLTGIKANLDRGNGYENRFTWTYTRGASGKLDTLYGEYSDGSAKQYIRPSATVSTANIGIAKVSDTYVFFHATRKHQHLFSPLTVNLFIQYLLNREDNLFNDGIFDNYSFRNDLNMQYKNEVTFNADSTLKTYQHIEPKLNDGLNDSEGLIFYYSKIAK